MRRALILVPTSILITSCSGELESATALDATPDQSLADGGVVEQDASQVDATLGGDTAVADTALDRAIDVRSAEASTDGDADADAAPRCPAPVKTGSIASAFHIDPAHTGAQPNDTLTMPLCQRWARDFGSAVTYPVIAEGKVFVIVGNNITASCALYALDLDTGATVWGPTEVNEQSFNPQCSVAYEAGRVFTHNTVGRLHAFDPGSGFELWNSLLPGFAFFPPALTAAGGRLFIEGGESGSNLYAADAVTGAFLWVASTVSEFSPPTVTADGVFVSHECDGTGRFSPLDGGVIWRAPSRCTGGTGAATVIYRDRLYARQLGAVFEWASGADAGLLASEVTPSFAAGRGYVVRGGQLDAIDADTWALQWSFSGDTTLVSAPIVMGQQVIVASRSGRLYVLDAATGTQLGVDVMGVPVPHEGIGGILAGFAAADGRLVAAVDTWLFAY